MKVNDQRNPFSYFNELHAGDPFDWAGHMYIKNDGRAPTATNVRSGSIVPFEPSTEVTHLDAEIVVKGAIQ